MHAAQGVHDGIAEPGELGLLLLREGCGEGLGMLQNPDNGRQGPGLVKLKGGDGAFALRVRAGTGAGVDALPELRCDIAGIRRGKCRAGGIGIGGLQGILIGGHLLLPGVQNLLHGLLAAVCGQTGCQRCCCEHLFHVSIIKYPLRPLQVKRESTVVGGNTHGPKEFTIDCIINTVLAPA